MTSNAALREAEEQVMKAMFRANVVLGTEACKAWRAKTNQPIVADCLRIFTFTSQESHNTFLQGLAATRQPGEMLFLVNREAERILNGHHRPIQATAIDVRNDPTAIQVKRGK